MSAAIDLTAPQRKALAEVATKDVTFIAKRNQDPEFQGARARRDVLEKLIQIGAIERGSRTFITDGWTSPVTVTPLGRAELLKAKADEADQKDEKDDKDQEDES